MLHVMYEVGCITIREMSSIFYLLGGRKTHVLARECLVCTTKYTAEKMCSRNLFLTSLSYQLAKFAITFSLDDEVLMSVISTVECF